MLLIGTLTTWIALNSFVLIMAHHQDFQQRLFDVISSNVDVNRLLPSASDRAKLDVVEATVLELLRYISHVPLGLPHFTTSDTSVAGFCVNKHTKVGLQLMDSTMLLQLGLTVSVLDSFTLNKSSFPNQIRPDSTSSLISRWSKSYWVFSVYC